MCFTLKKANLISYSKVTDKNKIISVRDKSKIYDRNNKLIAIAMKKGDLYEMKSLIINEQNAEVYTNVTIKINNKQKELTSKEKWHRILGHINFIYLNILCENELLNGVPKELESEYIKCAIYIKNKMRNLSFKNNRRKAKEILEIVHSDLNGPHIITGNCDEKYFLSFIDDYSKLAKVYCIKSKDQVYDCFVKYVNEVENLTEKRINMLRCHNGKEN